MNSNLFPRIAGVLGIHAASAGLYWAIVKFGLSNQNALSERVLGMTEGDPVRVQAYLDEMLGTLVLMGSIALLASALLAGLWLVMVDRNPPYGDKSARGKRGSWAGFLLLAVAVGASASWHQVIGAAVAESLAASLPITATALILALVVISYWLSTVLFVPSSTKIAVPGAVLFGS